MSRTTMLFSVLSSTTLAIPRTATICQSTLLVNLRLNRNARLISWFTLRCDLCCCTTMSTVSVTVRLPESVARNLYCHLETSFSRGKP
uniref:Putative secreted protein n=1 Tax=Anopheles marajoara TaxID=58244 RepID=A0A2M4CAL8_9DIPT